MNPETGRAAFERLIEVLEERGELMEQNAELRAALVDWARADRTASEAHNAWLSEAAKGGASYTGDKALSRGQRLWAESLPSFHALVQARTDKRIAENRLQGLARAALAATEEGEK